MTENAIKCSDIQFLTENSNLTKRALKPSIQAFACSITVLSSYNSSSKIAAPIGANSVSWLVELRGFGLIFGIIFSFSQASLKESESKPGGAARAVCV